MTLSFQELCTHRSLRLQLLPGAVFKKLTIANDDYPVSAGNRAADTSGIRLMRKDAGGILKDIGGIETDIGVAGIPGGGTKAPGREISLAGWRIRAPGWGILVAGGVVCFAGWGICVPGWVNGLAGWVIDSPLGLDGFLGGGMAWGVYFWGY